MQMDNNDKESSKPISDLDGNATNPQDNEKQNNKEENEKIKEDIEEKKQKNIESENNEKEKSNSKQKVTLADFEPLGSLGNGSFGEVSLVKKKDSDQYYAMKAINKNFLFKVKNKKHP